MKNTRTTCLVITGLMTTVLLTGCGGDNLDDLRSYTQEVKSRPKAPIEPLPEIKPPETFIYSATALRDPFTPTVDETVASTNKLTPDTSRAREVLEDYPLDALKMVGTVENNNEKWSLVRAPDGIVHRVRPSNHLGQNYGKIVSISDADIELIEIIADGQGGWLERPASLVISEE